MKSKIALMVLGIGILTFLFMASPSKALWWNVSWSACRNITIPANLIDNENISNFPMVLHLDSNKINYSNTQDSGADMRIVDATCNQSGNIVPYEIEFWNETGESPVWFLANLNAGQGLNYSYYYGNPLATDYQRPTLVWNNSFTYVWHMRNDTATNIKESRVGANGTIEQLNVTDSTFGQLDGSINITGNSGIKLSPINVTNAPEAGGTQTTLLAFVRPWKLGNSQDFVTRSYNTVYLRTSIVSPYNNLSTCIYTTSQTCTNAATNPLTIGSWNLVGVTYNGSHKVSWVNGSIAEYVGKTGTIPTRTYYYIGGEGGPTNYANSLIDEVEASNVSRSAAWINMTYKSWDNQLVTYGSEINFSYSYLQSQIPNVIEQTSNLFSIFISTTQSSPSIAAFLIYNNTAYIPSKIIIDNNNFYFNVSIISPILSTASTNMTWYWYVSLFNSTYFNSTSQNQTIYKMILTNCSASSESTTKALWYYIKNEETSTLITGNFGVTFNVSNGGTFERAYPFNFTGQNNYSVCIHPSWASYYVDAIGGYNASGYLQRSYYLTNHLITNSTETVNLLLSSSSTTLVTITVIDTTSNPQEGIDIIVQRYYPDIGIYQQVYSLRTGGDGKTIAYMIPYDTWYKFILSKDGIVLRTVNPMVITSSTLALSVDYPGFGESYSYVGGVGSSCSWNGTSSVLSCTVMDGTGFMRYACLNVSKWGAVGRQYEYAVCSASSSSTLIWTGGNASLYSYEYVVYAYFSSAKIIVNNGAISSVHPLYDIMGQYAIMVSLMIFMVVAFLSVTANPVIPIVMSCLAVIVGFLLGILPIGLGGVASIIVAGAIIAIRMRS